MRRALLMIALLAVLVAPASVATAQRGAYVAWLSGDEEVPRVATRATGMASFELTRAGLRYWLFVDNLENTMMGHIHIAPAGQNGAIAVWLYPSAPPARQLPGITSGLIGEGTITAANFTGPLANQQLTALINAIEAGNAYVNVHTSRFGGGEVRGQIR